MSDINFEQQVEQILDAIEEAIEDSGADIDFENSSGVLTLTCEDTNTQVIVSRQVAKSEIWVAARSGGFHCQYDGENWVCSTTKETLQALLSRVCTEQSDETVSLDWNV
jgi:iron-sulfur cluster assembly protein CyaY